MKETKQDKKRTEDKFPIQKPRAKNKKNPMGTAFNVEEAPYTETKPYGKTAGTKRRTPVNIRNAKSDAAQKTRAKGQTRTMPKTPETKDETGVKQNRGDRKAARTQSKTQQETPVLHTVKRKRHTKIIFLGGVGEIGKNMTAIEYGNDIVIVDAGMTFPNGEDIAGGRFGRSRYHVPCAE